MIPAVGPKKTLQLQPVCLRKRHSSLLGSNPLFPSPSSSPFLSSPPSFLTSLSSSPSSVSSSSLSSSPSSSPSPSPSPSPSASPPPPLLRRIELSHLPSLSPSSYPSSSSKANCIGKNALLPPLIEKPSKRSSSSFSPAIGEGASILSPIEENFISQFQRLAMTARNSTLIEDVDLQIFEYQVSNGIEELNKFYPNPINWDLRLKKGDVGSSIRCLDKLKGKIELLKTEILMRMANIQTEHYYNLQEKLEKLKNLKNKSDFFNRKKNLESQNIENLMDRIKYFKGRQEKIVELNKEILTAQEQIEECNKELIKINFNVKMDKNILFLESKISLIKKKLEPLERAKVILDNLEMLVLVSYGTKMNLYKDMMELIRAYILGDFKACINKNNFNKQNVNTQDVRLLKNIREKMSSEELLKQQQDHAVYSFDINLFIRKIVIEYISPSY